MCGAGLVMSLRGLLCNYKVPVSITMHGTLGECLLYEPEVNLGFFFSKTRLVKVMSWGSGIWISPHKFEESALLHSVSHRSYLTEDYGKCTNACGPLSH